MNTINVMRSFAIFLVICAHVNICPEDALDKVQTCSCILRCMALPGVFVFFLLAGYCLGYNKRRIGSFFVHKIQTIIFPWIVTGTMVFLWVYLRKHTLTLGSIYEYVRFILGIQTYLWYMTVLMILYIIFFLFRRWSAYLLLLLLSGLSFIFVSKWQPKVWNWGGDYLNIMNYFPYFILGYYIYYYSGKYDLFRRMVQGGLSKAKYLASLLCIISVGMMYYIVSSDIQMSYWNYRILPFVTITLLVVCLVSYEFRNNKLLNRLGLHSFSIYLLHMPVAGIIVNICNRIDSVFIMMLRPVIVLIAVECVILIFEKICHGIKYEGLLKSAIGIR